MITFANDLVDLSTRLQTFIMMKGSGLPEFVQSKLLEAALHPSPVDRIVTTAEVLYANYVQLDSNGREMCAQLAQFAAVNGWHGMTQRGLQIAQAMQRVEKHTPPTGTKWPIIDSDPAPLAHLVEPEDTDTEKAQTIIV